MNRWVTPAVALSAGGVAAGLHLFVGCQVGDLSVVGKTCSSSSDCGPGLVCGAGGICSTPDASGVDGTGAEDAPGSDASEASDATDAGTGCAILDGEVALARGVPQALLFDFANAPLGPSLDVEGACPIATGQTQRPTRAFVLVNATDAAATLSVWGVCSRGTDGVDIAEYARATQPSTASELGDCLGTAAVGFANKTRSPEDGLSGYCNGLMADAGHGMALAPCARATVVFEYDQHYPDASIGPAGGKAQLD
jgi:hypothetical protein